MASHTSDLSVTVQEPAAWSRRLSITVPARRVERVRTSIAQQYARNARLPGFRQGKLPQRIVEQRFGPSIEQEATDQLIQEAYREALQNEGLTPITQGQVEEIDFGEDRELRFEVEFEVQPKLDLERLSGFTVSRPAEEITDEDVDAVLDRLRDERAEWAAVTDQKPEYGNRVRVEITPLDDSGEPKEDEETREYHFVLGEGQAIPAVEESILTLDPGTQEVFDVSFPDDFPDEAQRGQSQKLQIRLMEVEARSLPDLDDEFAGAVGDFESMEALRSRIREDLETDAKQRSEAEVRRALVEQISEANPFEPPPSMVDRYLEHMTGSSFNLQNGEDTSPERAEQVSKLFESLRPQAELGMKRMMIMEAIAEREGLTASADEVDDRIEKLAEQHGRSPSEVWIELEKSGQLQALESEIMEDKVFGYLLENNTVV